MMSLSKGQEMDYAEMSRVLVLAVGFMLCLVGAGGLVMDDMGSRESHQSPLRTSAVIQAATGFEHEVVLPAAVSGAIFTLGVSVTLVAGTRRP